jgi:TrmH family RNA methyltransferase
VPTPLGARSQRVEFARELLTKKGRRAHAAFSFEGLTLLEEARARGTPIDALYATPAAYEASSLVRAIEAGGVPTFTVQEHVFAKISDVESPTGVLAVSPIALKPLEHLLREPGVVLVLADLNDPGNAGTLLRSAEAFGVGRVVFGAAGVEPHHPKVVRAAMGAIFGLGLAVGSPDEAGPIAASGGWRAIGLAMDGTPLDRTSFPDRTLLVVGHERRGLGPWEALCHARVAIAMPGRADSLNAAVAGSIALYEATKQK